MPSAPELPQPLEPSVFLNTPLPPHFEPVSPSLIAGGSSPCCPLEPQAVSASLSAPPTEQVPTTTLSAQSAQQSNSEILGSQNPHTSRNVTRTNTTRDQRLQIKTALLFGHKPKEISDVLGVSCHQIAYAAKAPLTPQHHKKSPGPSITTPQRARIVKWLEGSPSRRRYRYDQYASQIQKDDPALYAELKSVGPKAFKTAMKLAGYKRKLDKRKGCYQTVPVHRQIDVNHTDATSDDSSGSDRACLQQPPFPCNVSGNYMWE